MDSTLFEGLTELAYSAFPKRCASCGRLYETAAEYLQATQPINAQVSGLKQSLDDDGSVIVEVFRNCVCGSTLMDVFNNRRDISDAGLRRRQRFGELLDYLVSQNLEFDVARAELLKVLRGESSSILKNFKPPKKS